MIRSIHTLKKNKGIEKSDKQIQILEFRPILTDPYQCLPNSVSGCRDVYEMLNYNKDTPSIEIIWDKSYSFTKKTLETIL